jgi:hypothetical protein
MSALTIIIAAVVCALLAWQEDLPVHKPPVHVASAVSESPGLAQAFSLLASRKTVCGNAN